MPQTLLNFHPAPAVGEDPWLRPRGARGLNYAFKNVSDVVKTGEPVGELVAPTVTLIQSI